MTQELIKILKDEENPNILDYIDDAVAALEAQQQRIAELEAELVEERHRHDRYVDFEVAQAQELARVKAERDAAVADLAEICGKDAECCDLCAYGAAASVCMEVDFNCRECPTPCVCKNCWNDSEWRWRGVRQEGQV